MISFDFDYYKANNAKEAYNKYIELENKNKDVFYYNGGTELVTYARKGKINFDALIDINNIPACREHKINGEKIILGASLNLNQITEKNYFPLLSKSVQVIADHTTRNQITLGGNLTGRLPYKEALLPLLVTDAKITTIGKDGFKTRKITDLFDKRLKLNKGELLLQIIVRKDKADLPYYQDRKVKQSDIDYPIIHIAAIKENDDIKVAFSSLSAFPFRNNKIDKIMGNKDLDNEQKITKIKDNLPGAINSNQRAGKEYKEMLFDSTIRDCLECLRGAN
ncbi:MAG: FAD binding domain-containing protein [Halanaerobiales bacterium]|nr:FAD binding domain-containing protein [Halanaerobiales bacterium]